MSFILPQDSVSVFADTIKSLTKLLKKVQEWECRSGQNLTPAAFKKAGIGSHTGDAVPAWPLHLHFVTPSRSSRGYVIAKTKEVRWFTVQKAAHGARGRLNAVTQKLQSG